MKKKSFKFVQGLLFGIFAVGILLFTQGISVDAKDGYFVEINDRVYFRKYGKEALEKKALWGDYFNYPTGKGGSFVAAYDKKNGQVKELFKDDGGRLYYDDRRFYFEKRQDDENGHYKTIVYEVEKNGKNPRILAEYANILELSDRGYLVLNVTEPNEKLAIEVMRDGDKLFRTGVSVNEEGIEYIGIVGDYLLYGILKYKDHQLIRFDIHGMDLTGTSDTVKLGSLNLKDKLVDYIDIGNVVWKKGKAYFSAFCVEGSGHHISEGFVYRVDPKKKNSLKKITGEVFGAYDKIPTFAVTEKGKIRLFQYKENEVFTDKNSVYLFEKGKKKKLIVKDIRKLFHSSKGGNYELAAAEYIDGAVYMIVNKQKRDPAEDIGWREAFKVLERYYVRVSLKDGKNVTILYKDKF